MPPLIPRRSPFPIPSLVHGIAAFASRHAPGFTSGVLCHNVVKLLVIRQGTGWLTLPSRAAIPLTSGTVLLLAANLPHEIGDQPGHPLTLSGLCLDPRQALTDPLLNHAWSALLPHGQRYAILASGHRRSALERALEGIIHSPAQEPLRIAGWFRIVVAELTAAQREDGGKQPLTHFISWLAQHAHIPITVDEAAAQCGMSYRGFTSAFRQITGTTLVSYLHQLRIHDACERLITGEALTQVAYACGFNDLAHFHRVFKRLHGMPPAQWRDQALTGHVMPNSP